MPDYTEKQTLDVDVTGTEQVEASARAFLNQDEALKKTTADVYAFAESSEHATSPLYELAGSVTTVMTKVNDSRPGLTAVDAAMEEIAASSVRASAGMNAAASSAGKLHAGSGQLLQGVNSLGYAFQDFTATSGDLGAKLNSLSNNIQPIIGLLGVGGPYGAALAAAAVAGIAIYRNWETLSAVWENREPIEGAAQSVDGLTQAMKKNETALDALREKGSLNLSQMVEFNRLTKEQAKLESDLAAARETEANKKTHGEGQDVRSKQLGGAVGKSLDVLGGYEEVLKSFVDSYLKGTDLEGDEHVVAANRKIFEDLLNRALKGDKAAIKSLKHDSERTTGAAGAFSGLVETFDPQVEQKEKFAEKKAKDAEKKAKDASEAAQRGRAAAEAASKAEFDNDRAIEKAEADAKQKAERKGATEAERTAKKVLGKDAADATKQTREDVSAVNQGTSIDERAAAFLAQMRAQGGARDNQGRVRQMSDDEMMDHLTRQITQELQRAGMRPMRAMSAATEVAGAARQKVDEASLAAGALQDGVRQQGQAGQMGLNNQGKLIGVANALAVQAQQATAVQMQHGQAIDRLFRMAGNGLRSRPGGPRARG